MQTGAVTSYIDVAQIALYLFWIFFAGLVIYLHRENKREGYPLESDRSPNVTVQGWPPVPRPKTFTLRDGSTVTVPAPKRSAAMLRASPTGAWPGAPLRPEGDPMLAGVGPGSWAERADVPDLTLENRTRLLPLRLAGGFDVVSRDPDPRGLPVVGADGAVGGTVRDLWVDRAEMLFRYLEIEVPGGKRVLLPMNFARVGARRVVVRSILGAQFAQVPSTKSADQVTLLEEEKIMAFYGAGTLYAVPSRQEPML